MLAIAQVRLSYVLNFRRFPLRYGLQLSVGERREAASLDHNRMEIRRALKSSAKDSTVPMSMAPRKIISAFIS
jgi:hypothetical protein